MQVPSIRKSEGIFEIFVPGIFLSIHLLAGLIIVFRENFKAIFAALKTLEITTIFFITFLICFGYLVGMILRLLKASTTDNYARLYYKLLFWKKKQLWMTDRFPYFQVVRNRVAVDLPANALTFFDQVWRRRADDVDLTHRESTRFFNYCKNTLNKKDITLLEDIFAIEVTVRYLSGMFFSLCFASLSLLLAILVSGDEFIRHFILTLAAIYGIVAVVLIDRFRKMRIKEVELVFDASYQNRELFEPLLKKE